MVRLDRMNSGSPAVALYVASVLPDISPARGEIGWPLCGLIICGGEEWRKPGWQPISPLAGEMSGRTEGGAKERQLPTLATWSSKHGTCSLDTHQDKLDRCRLGGRAPDLLPDPLYDHYVAQDGV